MRLQLPELIATRQQVRDLAQEHNSQEVTELDFTGTDVCGGSAMDQLVASFPNATFINMDSFTQEEYEWVQDIRKQVAQRRSAGGDS